MCKVFFLMRLVYCLPFVLCGKMKFSMNFVQRRPVDKIF
jgi:hypothetical protein